MPADPFNGNVVVVTGASRGIGREVALKLAARGARLALAGRDEALLHEAAAECAARGGEALVVATDVGEEASCRALVERTVAHFGRLDTLVNNAGVGMWARVSDLADASVFERLMRVNYLGAVHCTFHALPHLVSARGRIVVVSSLAGRTGVPTRSGYAASKHALHGFFDSLRVELAGSGTTVTIVCPGFVATGIRERNVGPDGRELGTSPVREREVMSVDECARRIVRAAERREREVVMTARGRVGVWLKLAAPALVDRIAARAIARGK
jgi:NAD(P)-dependent dehydrogenase (short-subunit alcohol dehydrogenase family)